MSKSKGKPKKGGQKAVASEQEEDWDAILAEATASATLNDSSELPAEGTAQSNTSLAQESVQEDGSDDEDDEPDGNNSKKDKKKKKKKNKKDKEKDADDSKSSKSGPLTAAGKAILLRQQQLAEEEARIKKLQEEEEARIKEEEEREERERKAIEEEKARKRKAKQDKVEAQKSAGTYMTKAEKEKQKKAQAKIDAMRAAGMIVGYGPVDKSEQGQDGQIDSTEATKSKVVYSSKKKGPSLQKKVDSTNIDSNNISIDGIEQESNLVGDASVVDSTEPKEEAAAVVVAGTEDDDDDWETAADKIALKVETVARLYDASNVEDRIETDKRAEAENLRLLGVERAKRDEEQRIKKEQEEREHAEMEQKAREAAMRKELSRKRRNERDAEAKAARSPTLLRSPISCIMGHVDTGKTKLLDKIRHTNVQEGEAGGITQQIGATQFSRETLQLQTARMLESTGAPFDITIPGLLVIDTPGHESFTNLRSRGSSLCDIAILVIDLMHGLEQQTIESINMLKRKRTPFIVALNKVDRCYGWKKMPDCPIQEALAAQDENCRLEFKDRADRAILQLNEQGLNAKLYWENDDLSHTVSLVPTSAHSGEGVPDLLKMLITLSQDRLTEQLMYMEVLQCSVLEVKVVEGLGHTVDVILVNGTLREGDTIIVSTMEGPVVTQIRALLTPPPNREMRIKSEYVHHQELKGAIGIKIVAPDIGRAIAGTPVLVYSEAEGDDLDDVKEDVQSDLSKVMKALETDQRGVMVHASTLGALEALLQFLREETKPPIPVSHINIGPIYKKDIIRANIMNEKGQPEFATILAFDVPVDREARDLAEELNVRIFTAEIIYHLFDQFSAYMNGLQEARRKEAEAVAVFPCVLKILPQHVYNKKDPIVVGVEVSEGILRVGTPLTIPANGFLDVGKVIGIENNHKDVPSAKKGASVCIKISNESNPTLTYGRQFDHTAAVYSKISRQSIDALKEFFKDDLSREEWLLVKKMKSVFNIS